MSTRLGIKNHWYIPKQAVKSYLSKFKSKIIRKSMKIAVEGCCHGELDAIYQQIAHLQQKNRYKVDLLLICGDFEAIRNQADLQCMAVPQKYKRLGEFHKYYMGQKEAPVLTIVIGGNHEASNYLWELYHGGWLAPNIYFLGFSGCVRVNGLRIAGASGIYKKHDYATGYHEAVPYNASTIRSIYHTRQYDMFKLSQLSPPDIFLSHDWPNTIEQYGDLKSLLRRKPFFAQEAQSGTLGSPPLLDLLNRIQPRWWFSAHMHTKFEAVYRHDGRGPKTQDQNAAPSKPRVENPDEIIIDDLEDDTGLNVPVPANPDEIVIDDDGDDAEVETEVERHSTKGKEPTTTPAAIRETNFLALDKCLPKRDFLQVIDIPLPTPTTAAQFPPRLTFDPEWLAITRAFHPQLSTTKTQTTLPTADDARTLVATELEWVRQNVAEQGLREIGDVQQFWRTAPGPGQGYQELSWYTNPQTEALTQMLQIQNKVNPVPPGFKPPALEGTVEEAGPGKFTSGSRTQREAEGIQQQQQQQRHEFDSPDKWAPEQSTVVDGRVVRDGVLGDKDEDDLVEEPVTSGGWSPSRIVN